MDVAQGTDVGEVLAELATPGGAVNPYPLYERLRSRGHAVTGPDGVLYVTGYRACEALVRDHRLLKRPEVTLAAAGYPNWREHPALRMMFTSILTINPPEHTRLRRLVSASFTPRRVAALREDMRRIVDELCEQTEGEHEFVETFAFPLPVRVIGAMLGVPTADCAMFQSLVRDWTTVLDSLAPADVARADAAAVTIREYFADLAERRRAEQRLAERRRDTPREDMISDLVAVADDPDRLDAEELTTMVALLLAAGFETTTLLLANGVLALLDHPDQAQRLRTEPGLAVPAVEELLRYDSPVQVLTSRVAHEDMVIGETSLKAGQRVVTILGAANRDPDVFSEPDVLRLDRAERPPLSFGGGVHHCLGAPLARLEGQIALPALLRRFPRLALAGAPVPRDGLALHGYSALPLSAR